MTSRYARSIALCVALGVRGAIAAEPVSTKDQRVEVTLVSSTDTTALARVVSELLGRLHVREHIESAAQLDPRDVITPHPASQPAVARIWVELASAERATVYVVDGKQERILIRHVPLQHGLDEIAREEIAHIVEDSVAALLVGTPIGFGREEARRALGLGPEMRPPPPTQPPPRPPRRWFAELGAFYEVSLFANEARFAHGPGISLGMLVRAGSWRIGAIASGQYRNPVEAGDGVITVRLTQGTVRLELVADHPLARWVDLRFGAGGGPDIIDIDPRGPTGGPTLESRHLVTIAIARATVGLRWSLGARVHVVTDFGVDLDFSGTRYFVEQAGSRTYVLSPWPARPWTSAGVSLQF